MLKTVAIIPCMNQKSDEPGPAREVWVGHHFQATLMHVEEFYDQVFIISFKYGLITPDTIIEPYDINIHFEPWDVRVKWKRMVIQQVKDFLIEQQPGIVGLYSGKEDADWLSKKINQNAPDVLCTTPWRGKGVGQRIEEAYEGTNPFIIEGKDIRKEEGVDDDN